MQVGCRSSHDSRGVPVADWADLHLSPLLSQSFPESSRRGLGPGSAGVPPAPLALAERSDVCVGSRRPFGAPRPGTGASPGVGMARSPGDAVVRHRQARSADPRPSQEGGLMCAWVPGARPVLRARGWAHLQALASILSMPPMRRRQAHAVHGISHLPVVAENETVPVREPLGPPVRVRCGTSCTALFPRPRSWPASRSPASGPPLGSSGWCRRSAGRRPYRPDGSCPL